MCKNFSSEEGVNPQESLMDFKDSQRIYGVKFSQSAADDIVRDCLYKKSAIWKKMADTAGQKSVVAVLSESEAT